MILEHKHMKNKTFFISIMFIVILVGLFLIWNNNKNEVVDNVDNITPTNQTDNTQDTMLAIEYSLEDIALHNNENDCWTAVDESVYDLTSWINRHPGGREAILGLCGKDGSSAFNTKHGEQEKPVNQIASFKIGILK